MDAAKEAERQVALTLGKPGIGAAARRAQYRLQAAALRQAHAQLWGDISETISKQLEEAMQLGIQAGDTLQGLLGGLSGFDDMLQVAAQTADSIISRALNDVRFSRSVYNNRAWTNGKLDRIINSGIGAGKSAREIAADVRSFISPNTPGGVRYAAMRLGRTELNNAFHRTSVDMAKSQPWVEGVKWNLSGSHPRADICDEYAHADNGMGPGVYEPKDTPSKPHPQCLCYLTFVVPDRDAFLNNLANGDYDSWMNKLPDESVETIKDAGEASIRARPTQRPEWRPTMNAASADAYVKGTKFPQPLYHGTGRGASAIRSEGFSTGTIGEATGNYGMIGKGFYFTSDQGYARVYAGSGEVLETRILVRNPMPISEFNKVVADEGLTFTKEGSQRLAEIAQERGYDAVHLVPNPKFPMTDELVVFDPRQIVVVV
jgi:hypothetical protein